LVSALVVTAFLALNFFARWAFEGWIHWRQYAFVGIIVAQCNLIAVWSALTRVNIVVRFSWTVFFVASIWHSWILGDRVLTQLNCLTSFSSDAYSSDAYSGWLELYFLYGIGLVVAVVCAQIPIWIAANVFRWQLANCANDGEAGVAQPVMTPWRQFRLRDLLLTVFVLSLAIAPLHFVVPPVKGTLSFVGLDTVLMKVVLLVVCNLVLAVPCIWGAFLRMPVMLVAGAVWLLYCLALSWGEYAILQSVNIAWPSQTVSRLYTLNLSQCITVVTTLLIFRALGFRLVRGAKKRRDEEEASGTVA
jgi:hypothetical protein